jgi:hypothetical protein
MKRLHVIFAILILGLLLSCQNEGINMSLLETTHQKLSKSALSTLQYLKNKGYVANDLKPDFQMNGFVHGDMVFPFNLVDNLKHASTKNQTKNSQNGMQVLHRETKNISYYVESNFPEHYIKALDWARYYWSISSPNIEIRRTYKRSEADIICSSYFDSNDDAYAKASFPIGNGKVGNFLRINTRFDNASSTAKQKLVLMMHELGHNLGYDHSDQTFGFILPKTQSPIFHINNVCGSIMRSQIFECTWDFNNVKSWSVWDINAISQWFGYTP